MQPTSKNLVKHHTALESTLIKNLAPLGQSLIHGSLSPVKTQKILSTLETLSESSQNMTTAKASATKGIYRTSAGKKASRGATVIALIVIFGCIAWVIYIWLIKNNNSVMISPSNSTNTGNTASNDDSDGTGATLLGGGAALLEMLNNKCQSTSDKEKRTMKKASFMSPEEIETVKEIVTTILDKVQTVGPKAEAGLKKYQEIYPSLPSKVKNVLPDLSRLDPTIIGKITGAASKILSHIPVSGTATTPAASLTPPPQSDPPTETRLEIDADSGDEDN